MIKRLGIILFILFACLCSCGEYEALEIDKLAKKTADSLYRSHRDSLTKHFNTTCDINRDSIFQVYFDSLRRVEAEKIKRLIEK